MSHVVWQTGTFVEGGNGIRRLVMWSDGPWAILFRPSDELFEPAYATVDPNLDTTDWENPCENGQPDFIHFEYAQEAIQDLWAKRR